MLSYVHFDSSGVETRKTTVKRVGTWTALIARAFILLTNTHLTLRFMFALLLLDSVCVCVCVCVSHSPHSYCLMRGLTQIPAAAIHSSAVFSSESTISHNQYFTPCIYSILSCPSPQKFSFKLFVSPLFSIHHLSLSSHLSTRVCGKLNTHYLLNSCVVRLGVWFWLRLPPRILRVCASALVHRYRIKRKTVICSTLGETAALAAHPNSYICIAEAVVVSGGVLVWTLTGWTSCVFDKWAWGVPLAAMVQVLAVRGAAEQCARHKWRLMEASSVKV